MGELKIYEVKEKDWDNVNAKRCASCEHCAWNDETVSNYCDIYGMDNIWERLDDLIIWAKENPPKEEEKWVATSNESEYMHAGTTESASIGNGV